MRAMIPLLVLSGSVSCENTVPSEVVARGVHTEEGPETAWPMDLVIWPAIDTADAFNAEAIACLRRFCAKKMDPEAEDDYWNPTDRTRFGAIYPEVLYAEFDSVGDPRYPPTLMRISPTGVPDQRLLTVRWALVDSSSGDAQVRYVFDFLASRTDHGVRLGVPVDHRSRDWSTRKVGAVRYVISPSHTFSEAQAEEQRADIERLSAFFDVAPFPITYYSCSDPADLFRLKGYQHHPKMYVFPTGGMVDEGNNVYSGNDKDVYTHEVVHLFERRAFGDSTPHLLNEGLATFLGGSCEQPYSWHRANLARFLAQHDTVDLLDFSDPMTQFYIDEHTNVPYTVGALLCERILRRSGRDGLFAVMAAGEDPWPQLAHVGITKENFSQELRKEVLLPLLMAEELERK